MRQKDARLLLMHYGSWPPSSDNIMCASASLCSSSDFWERVESQSLNAWLCYWTRELRGRYRRSNNATPQYAYILFILNWVTQIPLVFFQPHRYISISLSSKGNTAAVRIPDRRSRLRSYSQPRCLCLFNATSIPTNARLIPHHRHHHHCCPNAFRRLRCLTRGGEEVHQERRLDRR